MGVSDSKKLRGLEAKTGHLKLLLANAMIENAGQSHLLEKQS